MHKIPIIFIHTKTFNLGESDTCRKGLIKLLINIYKDKNKVKESLGNYINILARGDEKIEEKEDELDEQFAELYNYNNINKDNKQNVNSIKKPFGLDDLEKLSKDAIRIKGIVSSYYEYLKNNIIRILTDTIVDLVIKSNFEKMSKQISGDIKEIYYTILEILNDKKYNLSDGIKAKNKSSLNNIFNYFKNNLNAMESNLKNQLNKSNLKEVYKDIIIKIYDNKSTEYKNEITYEEFIKNVDDLIYDNLSHNSNEIINNIFNIMFNVYVIDSLKEGIKEQFLEIEGEIVKEIYDNLFED